MKSSEVKKQVILGTPPSKSNMYRIIQMGKHASLAKTKVLKEYEKSFYLQCNEYRNVNICGLFELHLDVYLQTQRQDLDNILKGTLDCLQHAKAISNDNLCVKIIAQKFIDKANPRIEFKIMEV